jgi:hypothetical protein
MNTKPDGGQEQQQLQQALLGGQEQYLAEGKHCRLCYKTSSPETMIKPCACDGPLRYVHRQCLNELRAESRNSFAFTRCTTCGQNYWITRKSKYATENEAVGQLSKKGKRKLRWYLFKDSFLAMLVFQTFMIVFACAIGYMDSGHFPPTPCTPPTSWAWKSKSDKENLCGTPFATGGKWLNSLPKGLAQNMKTSYYLLALSLLLLCFLFAIVIKFCMGKGKYRERINDEAKSTTDLFFDVCCPKYRNYGYNYQGGCCVSEGEDSSKDCCSDCNCGGGGNGSNCRGSGGSCGGDAAIFFLVLIVVCMFLYLFVIICILITSLIFFIIQRHNQILTKKVMAKEYEICDLDAVDLSPDDEGRIPMSPDFDRSELSMIGLV